MNYTSNEMLMQKMLELVAEIQVLKIEIAGLRMMLGDGCEEIITKEDKKRHSVRSIFSQQPNISDSMKTKIYNIFRNKDIHDIEDLSEKDFYEVSGWREIGPNALAIIIVICQKYGVEMLNQREYFEGNKTIIAGRLREGIAKYELLIK